MSKLACVFPGQGSQSVGMLSDLAANFLTVKRDFEQASEALGYDLWAVTQNDDSGKLNQTEITQPALLTASIACWNVLRDERDVSPAFLAGHSLGEYTALVASNVISLETGVKLVQARGQFMQKAVAPGEGAMYAIIGLDDDTIKAVCERVSLETNKVVAPVNYNSPGQVVIAGAKYAADIAAVALKEAGAKRALPLAVSVPSHCQLMQGASEKLAGLLSALQFSAPKIAIVNNVDVAICENTDDIKDALVRQLFMPVLWSQSIQYLAKKKVDTIIEVGPGKVLSGLIKRIDKSISVSNINSPSDLLEG